MVDRRASSKWNSGSGQAELMGWRSTSVAGTDLAVQLRLPSDLAVCSVHQRNNHGIVAADQVRVIRGKGDAENLQQTCHSGNVVWAM